MAKLRIYYVWDENLLAECNRLPAVIGRASLVHGLITAYGLLDKVKVLKSSPASYSELKQFHSELYLDYLKSFTDMNEEYITSDQDEEYGIGYDCPPVSNMFELVCTIAGGSVTAAKSLVLGVADIVINWCGGWHHAQRFGAEGFCYINDIVLAIETLRRKFEKVLYIDLDVHHGNGVQDAYNLSKTVFTLSFHKYEPGFYPGTGDATDIGTLAGTGYSCNIPLQAAYSDETMKYIFERVTSKVFTLFAPDAIVVQCGADALAHDPHGGANLTIDSYSSCVRWILDKRKPTILLGGGGYKFQNVARLWTSLTALATETVLDENIPEHEYWPKYGPDFMLPVEPSLIRDVNTQRDLDVTITTVIGNLGKFLTMCDAREEPEIKKAKTDREKQNTKEMKKEQEISHKNSKTVDIYDFIED